MPLTATLHIDQPPAVAWHDNRMHIDIQCGEIRFTRILTRHVSEALAASLLRELAKSAGISVEQMRSKLANDF